MKLLFDQNISHKLITILEDIFPNSAHVYKLGLSMDSDKDVWNYAKENNFTIVTQDSDFNELSLLYGYPQKIIWLKTGNISTYNIIDLFHLHKDNIYLFEKDPKSGCLILYET